MQKIRWRSGNDREATVLHRCVTHSDSGLTWEADPRHAALAAASAPLDHEELEPDGQKPQRVSETGISGIPPT